MAATEAPVAVVEKAEETTPVAESKKAETEKAEETKDVAMTTETGTTEGDAKKRPVEEITKEESATSTEEKKPEVAKSAESPATKKATVLATPALIKKQIEYYFSDKNLEGDKFFYDAINAKKAEGGYISIDMIFSCNKIKDMKTDSGNSISSDDVVTALNGSTEVEYNAEKKEIRRKDNKDLPKFVGRKTNNNNNKKSPKSEHDQGVVFMFQNLPSDFNWTDVKTTVRNLLIKDLEDKKLSERVWVKYCSIAQEGTVYMSVNRFDNAMEYFKSLESQPLKITQSRINSDAKTTSEKAVDAKKEEEKKEGEAEKKEEEKKEGEATATEEKKEEEKKEEAKSVELKLKICHGKDLEKALSFMPNHIKEDRVRQMRKKNQTQPITIANIRIASMQDLKKKVKEIQNCRSDGEELNKENSDYKLVRELLEKFHPTGSKKLENEMGIKIDTSAHGDTRCFFVIKKDGTFEDFSMAKVYNTMNEKEVFNKK